MFWFFFPPNKKSTENNSLPAHALVEHCPMVFEAGVKVLREIQKPIPVPIQFIHPGLECLPVNAERNLVLNPSTNDARFTAYDHWHCPHTADDHLWRIVRVTFL